MVRFCSGFRDGTLVLAVEEGRDIITRTEKKNLELMETVMQVDASDAPG
jgi:hypothetical protein